MTKDEQIAELLKINTTQHELIETLLAKNRELIQRLEQSAHIVQDFKAAVEKEIAERVKQLPVRGKAN